VQEVKRIFKYLKGTLDFDLWYSRGEYFTLIKYTDAYWAGNILLFQGNSLVSWLSKKKFAVSLSTAKTKYIARVTCCTQVLWIKQTLQDIKVEYDCNIPIIIPSLINAYVDIICGYGQAMQYVNCISMF
jgi:hypothetical protein